MSISLPAPAAAAVVAYAAAADFPSRLPLREAAAPLLLGDRRVDPSMDRKSGKAEGHMTTCTSFRCLFLLLPLPAEAAFRAAAADDLAIVYFSGKGLKVKQWGQGQGPLLAGDW